MTIVNFYIQKTLGTFILIICLQLRWDCIICDACSPFSIILPCMCMLEEVGEAGGVSASYCTGSDLLVQLLIEFVMVANPTCS